MRGVPEGCPLSVPVNVPKLGISMTEATIVEWLVPDGGVVERGQPLYLLETDKVEAEIESPATGAVRHIGETGVTYPVGTLVGEIAES